MPYETSVEHALLDNAANCVEIPCLPRSAQQRAVQFILEFGTNLQRERLLYHFPQLQGQVSNQNVLAALGHYQNDDGGFGHGLEADLRTKQSTVIATTKGLRILDSVGALNSDVADRALKYLISNYKNGSWQCIHAHANDAPHAPWWHFDGDMPGFNANPSAEVLKYLLERNTMASETPALLEMAITHITNEPLEMHELLCYVALYESRALSHEQRIKLLPYMLCNGYKLVHSEPRQWEEYCLTPLCVTTRPTSIFAEFFADVIAENFQFLIESQHESGYWAPNWSWAGEFPGTWKVVETEIKAELTLNHLLKFQAFAALAR